MQIYYNTNSSLEGFAFLLSILKHGYFILNMLVLDLWSSGHISGQVNLLTLITPTVHFVILFNCELTS